MVQPSEQAQTAPSQSTPAEHSTTGFSNGQASVSAQQQQPNSSAAQTGPLSRPEQARSVLSHEHSDRAVSPVQGVSLGEEQSRASAAVSSTLSPEELQASRQAQAMAPGIDSLRKRRQQQMPQQTPAQHSAPMPARQLHQQDSTQSELSQHNRQGHPTDAEQYEQQAIDRDVVKPAQQGASERSSNSVSAEVQLPQQDAAQVSESDSLLDAIIAGTLDWEELTSAQEAATEQSAQMPSHHSASNHQQGFAESPSRPQTQSQPQSDTQTQPQSLQSPLAHLTKLQQQAMQSKKGQQAQPQTQASKPQSATQTPQRVLNQQQLEVQPQTQAQTGHQPWPETPSQTGQQAQPQTQARTGQQPQPWVPQQTPTAGSDATPPSQQTAPRVNSRLKLHRNAPGLQSRKQRMRDAALHRARSDKSPAAKLPGPSSGGGSATDNALPGGPQPAQPQQTKWRLVKSESTAAEEFVKPTADASKQRPAWASRAGPPATNDVEPQQDVESVSNAQHAEAGVSSESRALTKKELQALADRRGLDFERLLADARSRGIFVAD